MSQSRFPTNKDVEDFIREHGIGPAKNLLEEDEKASQYNKLIVPSDRERFRMGVAAAEEKAAKAQRQTEDAYARSTLDELAKSRAAAERAADSAEESLKVANRALEVAIGELNTARLAYENAQESNRIATEAVTAATRSAQAAENGVTLAGEALSIGERSASAAEKSSTTAEKQSCIAVWAAVAAAVSALISLFGLFAEKPPVIVHAPAQQAQSHSGASKSGWRTIETTHQLAPTIDH